MRPKSIFGLPTNVCAAWISNACICVLFLLLCGCTDKPDHNALTILSLGDSYTIGQSVPESDRWPVLMANMLRDKQISVSEPLIIAKTGWQTDELSRAIAKTNLNIKFDIVTLMIGVNDQYGRKSIDEFEIELMSLLRKSIELCKSGKAGVYVVSIPDWTVSPFGRAAAGDVSPVIDRFNYRLQELAESEGLKFVDISELVELGRESDDYFADDELHFSRPMHLLWARQVTDIILADRASAQRASAQTGALDFEELPAETNAEIKSEATRPENMNIHQTNNIE